MSWPTAAGPAPGGGWGKARRAVQRWEFVAKSWVLKQYGARIAQRCTDKDSIYLAACSLRDSFFPNEVSDLFGEPVDQKGASLGLPYQMAEAVLIQYQ